MREITIIFDGDGDRDGHREGRVADAIQKYIFKALSRERMNVLQFQNQQCEDRGERELGIPAFIKMYSVEKRDGVQQ